MRAQIALEYVIIVSFLLVVVGGIFFYAFSNSSETVNLQKAQNAVASIAKAVDQVYALGPGSQLRIEIDLPYGISEQFLQGTTLGYKMSFAQGTSDVWHRAKARLVGELPIRQGKSSILIQMTDSGVVRIGDGIVLTPALLNRTKVPGTGADGNIFNLKNSSTKNISNVWAALSGNITSYANIDGTPLRKKIANSLAMNADMNFNLNFIALPVSTPAGYYDGYLDVNSAEGYTDRAAVKLAIPHVLKTLTLSLYSDPNYNVPYALPDSFSKGEIVYYLVTATDQTDQNIDLGNLHINITNPLNQTVLDSNYALLNGTFKGQYPIDCITGEVGTWDINAEASEFQYASASALSFDVADRNQAADFDFSWVGSGKSGNYTLIGWTIQNIGICGNITIDEMTVWFPQTGGNLTDTKLDNTSVQSGNKSSGNPYTITAFSISQGYSTNNNSLVFSSQIKNNDTFQIRFGFSDNPINSTFTTVMCTWHGNTCS